MKYNNTVKEKKVIDEYSSLEESLAASDFVVKVFIKEVTNINKFVSFADVDIIYQYKGELSSLDKVILPSSVESGKEYLLFLQKLHDGSLTLSSRKGSMISKDDTKKWNLAIDALKE